MTVKVLSDLQESLLHNLNDRQKQAVMQTTGSTLVIAGAGSGKTAVLTKRCAFLIAKGVEPGKILSLTFTNKAAGEMRLRVERELNSKGIYLPSIPPWKEDYTNQPLLCTFHSLGVRLLREFGEEIGVKKEFNIIDPDDQKKIIKKILKDLDISEKVVNPKLVSYFITQCKQELLTASQSRKLSKEFLPVFHKCYRKYEEELHDSQVVDFDDLLLLTYKLLSENEGVLDILRQRWTHLQIDEFQDTNQAQFEIVKLLSPVSLLQEFSTMVEESGKSRSLFVVGDDAQSIYGFRGSKIEIILNFEEEYPGSTEIILNQNYRSTQPILDLAEKVLSHNPNQKKKELFTQNKETIDIHYYLAKSERDEAQFIVRKLYDLFVNQKKVVSEIREFDGPQVEFEPDGNLDDSESPSQFTPKSNDPVSTMFDVYLETDDFKPTSLNNYQPSEWQLPEADWKKVKKLNEVVVLYRTHGQSRSIEEAFLKNHIPYRLVSGVKFLERKEIKDVLSILRFLANGDDKVSLGRFLPLVMEGVGPKTMEKIFHYLEDYDYPLAPKVSSQVMDIFGKMQQVWMHNQNLIDLTKEILAVSGYFRYLKGEYPNKEDFETRMENIGEIYSLMFQFDTDKTVSLSERLNNFLAHVSLMTTQDIQDDDTPKVNLMSLHQSKGLEFETVFLVGIEDNILPHQNSLVEPGGLEEEVRLAYVGITRAKQNLFLSSADSRVQFGQIQTNPVSRIFRPFLNSHCKRGF